MLRHMAHISRLVLLAAALLIATVAGDPSLVPREFLATFSNEKFVVPICTAMGSTKLPLASGAVFLWELITPMYCCSDWRVRNANSTSAGIQARRKVAMVRSGASSLSRACLSRVRRCCR